MRSHGFIAQQIRIVTEKNYKMENSLQYINKEKIEASISNGELIEALKVAFANSASAPDRLHADFPNNDHDKLLLMPAWLNDNTFGVKITTVMPNNPKIGHPTIGGMYILFNSQTGVPLAILDASTLTLFRTAAVSALASKYLSREVSRTLLIIGTGALVRYLANAHCEVRPISKILVWGRNFEKAKKVASGIKIANCEVQPISELQKHIGEVDIISSATSSNEPSIYGDLVAPGTHVDLVGSFAPDMREADSQLFSKANVFVDTYTAIKESGDLIFPINEGMIKSDIFDLATIIKSKAIGRNSSNEITVFKSVGTGIADVAAANYVFEKRQLIPTLPLKSSL